MDKDTLLKYVQALIVDTAHKPMDVFTITNPTIVKVGDIIIADSKDTRAMVVVLDIDDNQGIFKVALIHSCTDFASSRDCIIRKDESDLPFDIVVQTDLICYIDKNQAIKLLTNVVDLPFFRDIKIMNDHKLPAERRGTPLQGEKDARWSFKLEELTRLQELCVDCVTRLMGD